jgi:type IV pilus assembly protein PilV
MSQPASASAARFIDSCSLKGKYLIMVSKVAQGFSLVETLVSVFILCIGVIGAASLQLTAFRTTQQSGMQMIALQLASEISDTIQAQVALGSSDQAIPFWDMDFNTGQDLVAAPTTCFGVKLPCDHAQITAFTVHETQRRMKESLPQGRIKICRDSAPWDKHNNRYQWACQSTGPKAPIVIKLSWRENAAAPKGRQGDSASSPQLVLTVGS